MLCLLLFSALVILSLRMWQRRKLSPKLPYPPGPPGLPVLGNVLDMPTQYAWLTFARWAKQYGDIVHLNLLGRHIVILNTMEAVKDLLDGRSAVYSEKYITVMSDELMGWSWALFSLPFGEKWKRQRKILQRNFNANAITRYQDVQIIEARRTALRLAEAPHDFIGLIRLHFATTVTRVVYGYTIANSDDEYYKLSKYLLEEIADAFIPGRYLVELLPILKHVPAWIPGAEFQRKARNSRRLMAHFRRWLYDEARTRLGNGTGQSCLVVDCLQDRASELSSEESRDLMDVAAVCIAGGADTTVSSLTSFFLAMSLFPDVQRRAQAQIDAVVGQERLPTFEDLEQLPYVQAMFKELLRWQPVLPIGGPHLLTRDDEYCGYHIPKGTLVIGNAWAILHDEKTYKDPMSFLPERFLTEAGAIDPEIQNPDAAAFGYGRRKCPGQFFAESSGLITLATFLSVFDVSKDESSPAGADYTSHSLMSGNPLS